MDAVDEAAKAVRAKIEQQIFANEVRVNGFWQRYGLWIVGAALGLGILIGHCA
jgi:hypothetical protein